jgi:hypothetical protein
MQKSESIKEISAALSKVQADIRKAKKDKINNHFKTKYADLEQIIDICKECLPKNGISFSQFPITENDMAGVETILMHSSGEWMSQKFLLPYAKNKDGSLNTSPQTTGICVSYARRYTLSSIIGIPTAMCRDTNKSYTAIPQSRLCECGAKINGNYPKCFNCNIKGKE